MFKNFLRTNIKYQLKYNYNLIIKSNTIKKNINQITNYNILKNTLFKNPYFILSRCHKPIGTFLLFWPCCWSILLATHHYHLPFKNSLYMLGFFGIGSIIMRSAGCVINDLWDVKFDKKVERTKNRPLANDSITKKQAIKLLTFQLFSGLIILLQFNYYSIILGSLSLVIVGLYPYMKRVTYWPQLFLGLAFNWGALLGWSSMIGYCDWNIVLPLYFAGINWTLFYDTIYAHQDKIDDIKVGVKSTALLLKDHSKKLLTFFAFNTISLLGYTGYIMAESKMIYFYIFGCGFGGFQLLWQILKVDLNKPKDCFNKFKSNHYFGILVTIGIFMDYLNPL